MNKARRKAISQSYLHRYDHLYSCPLLMGRKLVFSELPTSYPQVVDMVQWLRYHNRTSVRNYMMGSGRRVMDVRLLTSVGYADVGDMRPAWSHLGLWLERNDKSLFTGYCRVHKVFNKHDMKRYAGWYAQD